MDPSTPTALPSHRCMPRYTCNGMYIQKVLSYISSWGNNDSLSLKQLSWKNSNATSVDTPL